MTFKTLFCSEFVPFFQSQGFREGDFGVFVRDITDVEHLMSLCPVKTKDKLYLISVGLGIRVPSIEFLRRPNKDYRFTPTVGKPLHLLKPDKAFRPWKFQSESELKGICPAIKADILTFGVPFLDRFSDSRSVYEQLASENPGDWFMCTPDDRDTLLVYFELENFGRSSALRLATALLKKYEGRPPKYSVELMAVKRFLEAG